MSACIGEPVSWLRLERFALGELGGDTARDIAAHLGQCPACKASLDRIETDDRVLPLLPAIPARAPQRWWSLPKLAWSGGLLAAAAALLLIVVIGRDPAGTEAPRTAAPPRLHVKGAGEVVVTVVRDRGGAVTMEAATFEPADRFKLQVTCTHAAEVFADVVVFDPAPSFPLPSARLRCGNQVVLPGAFRITSDDDAPQPAIVCIAIDPDHPPDRAAMVRNGPASAGLGCVQLAPE